MAVKKKIKFNNSILLIAASSLAVAGLTAYSFIQVFQKVPVLIAKSTTKVISAFSSVNSNNFDTIYVSKADKKTFESLGYATTFNQISGKIPKVDLQPGVPVSKNSFISAEEAKNLSNLIISPDGRDIRLYVDNKNCYDAKFDIKSKIDLYFMYTTKENVYMIPVRNLLTLKNKTDVKDGTYIEFEAKDNESQYFLLLNHMVNNKMGYFTISLPGIQPRDFKSIPMNLNDFIANVLQRDVINTSDKKTSTANQTTNNGN